jgi:hypothetical protein
MVILKSSQLRIKAISTLIWPLEQSDHAIFDAIHVRNSQKGGEKMIEKGLILTGDDAELLSRTLSEIKTRAYESSETILDDTQALDALISFCAAAQKGEEEKETFRADINPLRKHLVLGTVIGRHGGAKHM